MNLMNDFAFRFTQAAAHFLWVGALIVLGLYLIDRLVIRSSAARHAWYLLGMMVMILALPICFMLSGGERMLPQKVVTDEVAEFSVTSTVPDSEGMETAASGLAAPVLAERATEIAIVASELEEKKSSRWEEVAPWVMGLYLIGLAVMLFRLALGWWGSLRLRARSEAMDKAIWSQAMASMSEKIGVRVAPVLRWSREVASPVVIGFAKPVILLPMSLVTHLSMSQVEAVLAHELAHLHRRDTWALVMQRVVETILFFHPLVWWMSRQLEKAREEACDDLVVAAGCDPAEYAEALVLCSELRLINAGVTAKAAMKLAAAGEGKEVLRQRVFRLLGQKQQSSVRLGRAGWVTGLLVLSGVIIAVAAGQSGSEELTDFEKGITGMERKQIPELVQRAEKTDDKAIGELVAMGAGVAPEMVPLFKRGGTDTVGMRVLSELIEDQEVQVMLVKLLQDPNSDSNTIHCSLTVLSKSGNPSHLDLIASFLASSDIAAINALAEIGGEKAREHLIAAFDVVPTERWWLLANALGSLGDPAAVPELKSRLAVVELPPSERFPKVTVSSFTSAIAKLTDGEQASGVTSFGFGTGKNTRYPYGEPGAAKTFSVSPRPQSHYAKIPQVDSNSSEGRAEIWQALADATKGPGFTLDGDEVVLFNGLRAVPLWENGAPYPTTMLNWLGETSHRELKELLAREGSNERVGAPESGYLLAGDPEGLLYVLGLRKPSEDSGYNISVLPQDSNLQLITTRKEGDEFTMSQETSMTLHDLESGTKDGAFDMTRGLTVTMTEEKWGTAKEAILVVEFVRDEVGLVVAQAEAFPMAEMGDDWNDGASVFAALRKAQAGEPQIQGHQLRREEGAFFMSLKIFRKAVALPLR